jgi:hypothetical protein
VRIAAAVRQRSHEALIEFIGCSWRAQIPPRYRRGRGRPR